MSQENVSFSNPEPLEEADVYAACRAFVLEYAQPALEPENVIRGWRNRDLLPAGNGDFAVISLVSSKQRGNTVETFTPPPAAAGPGRLDLRGLMEIRALVDFCADSDLARLRAQRLVVAARSGLGVRFFNERGLSVLHAGKVVDKTWRDEGGQFQCRYSAALHLSCWSGLSLEADCFDSAILSRLENAEVHHTR